MSLFIAVFASCFVMFWQDFLGVGLTISQSRGLRFFPGFFDGLGDYANKYGFVVIAWTTGKFGPLSWQTFLVVTAMAATSFFTSNLATGKESMILPKDRAEKVTLSGMWQRIKAAFTHD